MNLTTPAAACGRFPLEGAPLANRQSRMRGVCWRAGGLAAPVFASSLLLSAVLVAAVQAQEPAPAPREIVQQRLPDGSVIFTDRPQPGAKTERSWQVTPDDAGAEARRAEAQRNATAVIERAARQREAERDREAERQIAADRLAAARAERDAEQARLRALEAAREPVGTAWVQNPQWPWFPPPVPPIHRPPWLPLPEQQPWQPLPVGTPQWRPGPQSVPSALPPRPPQQPSP